ncbi:segregation/condensation protein A [Candidatus Woesearchaeota archaeon]|nr:segregation/condensation protein A [Candidatus Woesearchaeota archaeon]
MQQQIFDLLLEQEDVTWKTILYDLVNSEQMDPWDIDITLLSKKYIQIIKEMQEHDFRISGKILLAAAFLLKIKSAYLIEHDISNLDALINSTEEAIDEEELFNGVDDRRNKEKFQLIPRNPQPRSRKVSIHDLIEALQKAMETKRKILARQRPTKFVLPEKKIDILGTIRDLYHKIVYYSQQEKNSRLTFSTLLPTNAGRREKVYTFIPLLHLENQGKVETTQEKHFDEIYVKLLNKKMTPEKS